MLPVSERARTALFQVALTLMTGVEQVLFRGDMAEVRIVNGDNFEETINTPDRLVIVDFHHEEISAEKSEKSELDAAISRLPSKVIVAKVLAGRNIELMDSLRVHNVPTKRVYREGKLLEEFKGSIDQKHFLSVVNHHIENPNSQPRHEGYIGPLSRDWLPDGVEERPADGEVTPLDFGAESNNK